MYAGGRKVMLVYFSLLYLKLRIIFIFLTVSKIYFVFFLSISFGTFTFIPNSIWTNQIINSSKHRYFCRQYF